MLLALLAAAPGFSAAPPRASHAAHPRRYSSPVLNAAAPAVEMTSLEGAGAATASEGEGSEVATASAPVTPTLAPSAGDDDPGDPERVWTGDCAERLL